MNVKDRVSPALPFFSEIKSTANIPELSPTPLEKPYFFPFYFTYPRGKLKL